VLAQPVRLAEISPTATGWDLPDPWFEAGDPRWLPLAQFPRVWMRKDPPVDEAYLYATHLLELAERLGVRVLNRPASLRAWNEKLGALRWSHLMAPSLVSSDAQRLETFAVDHGDVVLKPLGGRAGQGVVRSHGGAPGLKALLELVTNQQQLPVMVQAFLPAVTAGAELAPALQAEGLFFVGIDVIDGRLSEINVTSPTGVREVERLGGIPLADLTMERLLA
jgi:glutathione synthase